MHPHHTTLLSLALASFLTAPLAAGVQPSPEDGAPPPVAEGQVKVQIFDWVNRDVKSQRRLLTEARVMVNGGRGKIRIFHGERRDLAQGFELRFLDVREDVPTLALVNLTKQGEVPSSPVALTRDRPLLRVEPGEKGYGLISLSPEEAETLAAPPGSYDLLVDPAGVGAF